MCAWSNPNPKAAPSKIVKPPLRLRLRRFSFAKRSGDERSPEEKARTASKRFARYRFDPENYIIERLGWTPWRGTSESPGQCDILDAYTLALRQQHEKRDWEQGKIAEADLQYWKPGQVIKNRIRVEAGHTVGKTKVSSGFVNHFFDCFPPAIVYTFAPTKRQIHDLLWKEIKTDRRGKRLPGRILDLELKIDDNHFAVGMATNDSGGKGTERVQGQHGEYLLFLLDEAEGIPDFVWSAIDSMASGGIVIILMFANPRTRSSKFHKAKTLSTVRSFRMSCLAHPNVLAGKEIIPGAVLRDYVASMVEKHCEVTSTHDDDQHTFTLPFDLQVGETTHPAGTIFLPNSEFLFRVLGIAPANIADNTLITVGRLEAACKRVLPASLPPLPGEEVWGHLGCDVSGFGKDFGTLYIRFLNVVWRAAQLWKQDYDDYARCIREEALKLKERGCTHLSLRIDAGGGFGQGVISHLKKDMALRAAFPDERLIIHEIHFGSPAKDGKAYHDVVTELYAQAGETLQGVRVDGAPPELEEDLCERIYEWVNAAGVEVKKLEVKKAFKKRHQGRSPDDGDGFVLCAAPEFLFGKRMARGA